MKNILCKINGAVAEPKTAREFRAETGVSCRDPMELPVAALAEFSYVKATVPDRPEFDPELKLPVLSDTATNGAEGWRFSWTLEDTPMPTEEDIIAERVRRLAAGFDYDFGDERGIHRIGTTPEDMLGWDEVTKCANALINVGSGSTGISIVTDTGFCMVTALEWQAILIAAMQFRQPIYAASFALQAMDPKPRDFADGTRWL